MSSPVINDIKLKKREEKRKILERPGKGKTLKDLEKDENLKKT